MFLSLCLCSAKVLDQVSALCRLALETLILGVPDCCVSHSMVMLTAQENELHAQCSAPWYRSCRADFSHASLLNSQH